MNNQHNRVPVAYAIKKINAIEVLGGFSNAARESGWTAAQVQEVVKEAMSGDYEHLHSVLAKYCVAPSGRPSLRKKSNRIVENTITVSLSLKSAGVVEGHLYRGGEHLLSVVHPTSMAAAIFAMGESKVLFLSDTECLQFPFPISFADLTALGRFANSYEESYFIAQFAKSSWFDFLNPHPADNKAQAEFHLAVAVSHLPQRLVKKGPSSSLPKGLTEKLRSGNRVSPFGPD